jgi:enoyl-[acyl-carrier protein] reductase II
MLKTAICELFGIEYPVIQGGMAWVSAAPLVAAVSNGGGLGVIGCGGMEPDVLAAQIEETHRLTKKPFGVNVLLTHPKVDQLIEVILNDPPAVVSTGAGNPGKYVPALKEKGIKVVPVIPSVALAQRMQRAGVDAVVAEGTESGGHVGELTTMVLVPQVVEALSIPVLAAGGIIDSRGLVAALALGADGVQMGTRFLAAAETPIHANVKAAVLRAKDRDTIVTGRSTGHPVRVIKNKLSRELERLDLENKPHELEKLGVGKMRLAMLDGDIEWGSLMCGQGAGMVTRIQPAAEIIEELIDGANVIIDRLAQTARLAGIMRS